MGVTDRGGMLMGKLITPCGQGREKTNEKGRVLVVPESSRQKPLVNEE